jgi:hypothetical protein
VQLSCAVIFCGCMETDEEEFLAGHFLLLSNATVFCLVLLFRSTLNGLWEALAVRGGPCIDLLLPVRDFLVAFLKQERVCMAWCKASAQLTLFLHNCRNGNIHKRAIN